MKLKLVLSLAICTFLSSCIKNEALNMEADIVSINVPETIINGQPVINNDNIVVYVKEGVKLDSIDFDFEITPGATVSPSPKTRQNFNKSVVYTVKSEDGRFEKKYRVSFLKYLVPLSFDFENFEIEKTDKFVDFFELIGGVRQNLWASGNRIYAISISGSKAPDAYPTSYTEDAQSGKYALALETKSTGFFGQLLKKPIAAGNMFIGSFDVENGVIKPLEATHFGLPFNQVPVKLTGYFKYTPGKQMTNSDNKPIEGEDEGDIYAVLFNKAEVMANNPKVSWLDGRNVFTDPSIVAIARIASAKRTPGTTFARFEAPFEFKKPLVKGEVDANVYSLVIVASSSKEGDLFKGAVGSRMIVDNLKIEVK
ncbi:PCMD domain-containing protein [Sphingobacterium sp. MYb382]|uniref:PCMD domain-containing protein n=1 Tax=Sphingobacterium sp. MYb382 TaxID=2745278 RepID=UPI0030AD8FA6